jgi:hypothetical protein
MSNPNMGLCPAPWTWQFSNVHASSSGGHFVHGGGHFINPLFNYFSVVNVHTLSLYTLFIT